MIQLTQARKLVDALDGAPKITKEPGGTMVPPGTAAPGTAAPGTPAPSMATAASAAVTRGFRWTRENLAVLGDSVFGKGWARSVIGPERAMKFAPSERLLEIDQEKQKPENAHSVHAQERLSRLYNAEWDRLEKAAQPKREEQDFEKLRKGFLAAGVDVPGLSYAGLGYVEPDRNERDRADYQARVNEYCAVLSGDEKAQRSASPIAKQAREFLSKELGKAFAIGDKIASLEKL
jgi:hypothetical protein